MSIKTFLSKIWAEIKTLFDNMPAELQYAAHVAVTIVENLKILVDDPAVDVITAIIPGDLDDRIVAWLRNSLPVILTDLRLVDNAGLKTNPASIAVSAVKIIKSLNGDIKNAFLHDLGVLIAQDVAKAKQKELSWKDAVYIVEWYYQHKFKTE